MAGHSKWANIKHRKGAQDKKRGKIFSRLIREINAAVHVGGGGDPTSNSRLRLAIDKAFAANMTKDTVERAVKRAAGGDDGANVEEVRYEGYGPQGVAVMVDCMTDNRNRTVAAVRHAFTKCGGNLGTDGSVSYQFAKQGIISYAPGQEEDEIMDPALEAGAQDVIMHDDGSIDVITDPDFITDVKDALVSASFTPDDFTVSMEAENKISLDQKAAEKMLRLLDMLEECDDVQDVFSNADISDEVMEALSSGN
jgi:YebC/PmpR family DNA-binding regulatory protein